VIQEAGVSLLGTWQNFYIILGAAAATLTGLMFVVITLMTSVRVRVSTAYTAVAAFNTPTVVHFCLVLLLAVLISAPWQALWQVSLVLGLTGLGGGLYILSTIPQMRNFEDYQPKRYDWVWYITIPIVTYACLIVAAILLPGYPAPNLYAIAAVALILLFTGIHNAWDLVVYLAVERAHPEGEDRK
jgi:hypothetical protein